MKTLFAIAALAATTLSVGAVRAETTTVTHTVASADLDLARHADVARLDARLTHAIVDACGPTSAFDLAGQNAVRRCIVQTHAAIAPQRDRLVAQAQVATLVAAR